MKTLLVGLLPMAAVLFLGCLLDRYMTAKYTPQLTSGSVYGVVSGTLLVIFAIILTGFVLDAAQILGEWILSYFGPRS